MEFVPRPADSPKDSRGAGADVGKILQATALAAQLGKTVEEVLAFMGAAPLTVSLPTTSPQVASPTLAPAVVAPIEIFDEEPLEEVKGAKPAKVIVPVAAIPEDDKFVVTEIVNLEDASEADLDKLAKEDEDDENDWTGKIRVGSKVKIVYQVSATRINWIGKKGKVVRIVGNEAAKVFDVEFTGGKIPKIRLNKKTGKLERGYEKKVIRNTFSEDQIELAN